MDKRKTRLVASKGVAAVLTASMALGSFPLAALAETSDSVKAQAAELTAAAYSTDASDSEFRPIKGMEYTAPISITKQGSDASSMAAGFFEKNATFTWDGSKYTVVLTATDDAIKYNAEIVGSQKIGTKQFALTFESISGKLPVSFKGGPMTEPETADLTIDTTGLQSAADFTVLNQAIATAKAVTRGDKTEEAWNTLQQAIAEAQQVADNANATQDAVDEAVTTLNKAVEVFNNSSAGKPDTPEAYDSDYQVYFRGEDATDANVGVTFGKQVKVVPQADGSYVVELTALSQGEAAKFGDVVVNDAAVKYTDNSDGTRTYELPTSDLKATLNFTYSYTTSTQWTGEITYTKPYQIVLKGGSYDGYVTTKAYLEEQIGYAKDQLKYGDKKVQTAKDAFQKAIDEAQKVVDDAASTPKAYADAVLALDKAANDFRVAPNEGQEPTTPADGSFKVYYKGVDATDQYGKSFQNKVKTVKQDDGTYLVELTANSISPAGALGDVTVNGVTVKYTDNADGSRTYELPTSDLKATLNFTFSYSFNNGAVKHVHPFQLVLDGGSYDGIAGFVDEQVKVGENSLKAGENKTDDAKSALQKAIDAAKAASTDDERANALSDLVTAIDTFNSSADKPTEPVKVDKSELSKAIEAAKEVEKGNKTDEAYKALTDVIAKAEAVFSDDKASQVEVNTVTAALNAAVKTFNDSKPAEKPTYVAVKDMKVGQQYEVPVSYLKYTDSSQASMVGDYFSKTAIVVPQQDGTYAVRFTLGTKYLDFIEGIQYDLQDPSSATDPKGTDAKDLGNGGYEIVVKSLDKDVAISFKVKPMNGNWAAALMRFDTSSIKDLNKKDDGQAPSGDNNNGGQTDDKKQPTTNPGAPKPTTKPSTTATKAAAAASKKLPQTSDPTSIAAMAAAAVAGIGAVGAGVMDRIRRNKRNN